MNLNFNFSGATLLKDWWKQVRTNFQTVQDNFNSHVADFEKTKSDINSKIDSAYNKLDKAMSAHTGAQTIDHPDKSVTRIKIADKAIGTEQLADKAVGTEQLADYSVGEAQLAQYAVTSDKICPQAVQTSHIKDGNVTDVKLSSDLKNKLNDFQNKDTDFGNRIAALENNAVCKVDNELSLVSANPVENLVITKAIKKMDTKKEVRFICDGTMSEPYLPNEYEDIVAVDINLNHHISVNGIQLINLPIYTIKYGAGNDRVYICISYDAASNTVEVFTSYNLEIESNVNGSVWTFTFGWYTTNVSLNDDIDSPDYGKYQISSLFSEDSCIIPYENGMYQRSAEINTLDGKIDIDGDVSDTSAAFTQAAVRSNLTSGEKLSVFFGKIAKWFADLKTVAFTGSYTDLSNKPTIPSKTSQLTNDSGFKTTDSNTTYQLTKTGSTIKLTGSDGSETSVTDSDTNTTYGVATISASGLMSAADKTKLNGIATGANKTTVDTALSSTSTNPVQNKVVQEALNNKADADILGTFVSSGFAGIGEVTDQLLDCRRSATIVVGASDSKYYSDYSYSANYKCTGTADQGQINSAIAALPSSGGKIVLLEGTYNISGSINVNKPNVTIEGMGNGTVLKTSSNISAINVSSSNCEIRYLSLICTASDRYGNGIYVTGSSSIIENIRITHFEHNIYLAPGSDYAIVTKCYLYDGEGICARSKYCIISDNSIENYDWAGIYLYGPSYCNVTGNILKDTGFGIFSQNAETQYNKVSNNYILRGTGTSADYPSGKYSIYITAGTYNYFSDNYIPGKNYVNNAGSTNTFTNNRYS